MFLCPCNLRQCPPLLLILTLASCPLPHLVLLLAASTGVSSGAQSWAAFPTTMPPSLTIFTADATNVNTQLWAEEFSDANVSGPNPNTWSWQIGDGTNEGLPAGWGNGELECYADNNSGETWPNGTAIQYGRQVDGSLVITTLSKKKRYCWNSAYSSSVTNWASARINTRNKVAFVPTAAAGIRVEARIKVPTAKAIW